MFDLPLHPIVVHFPIALSFLIPVISVLILLSIKKGWLDKRAWAIVVSLQVALVGFSYLAGELGEDDEHAVEEIVGDDAMHEHEEWGERVLYASGATAAVAISTIAMPQVAALKAAFMVMSFGSMLVVGKAGHTGGKMVYHMGAAKAHYGPGAPLRGGEDHIPVEDDQD